jgi:hypothetical protein
VKQPDEPWASDFRVVSVSPDGEVLLRWRGGALHLRVPVALAHYYRRLVPAPPDQVRRSAVA